MFRSDVSKYGKWSKNIIDLICDDCGVLKSMTYKLYTSYGYMNGEYYCRECKMKRNNQKKYGVDNVFQLDSVKNKIKETNLGKYGVGNPSQNNLIKNKIKHSKLKLDKNISNQKRKETVLRKYGVDNISKLESIKLSKQETSLINNGYRFIFEKEDFYKNLKSENKLKYGVEYIFQNDDVKQRLKNTNIIRYGVDNPSKNKVVRDKIISSLYKTLNGKTVSRNPLIISVDNKNKRFNIRCESCGEDYDISYSLYHKRVQYKTITCVNCNPINKHVSGKEISLYHYIKSIYRGEIIRNFRIDNKEIDVYLPELNIGYEFNGVYWHSDIYVDKYYHRDKVLFFEKHDVKVIYIWEDDWDFKRYVVKNKILQDIGGYEILSVEYTEIEILLDENIIEDFYMKNTLESYVKSDVNIGLFHMNDLVSILSVSKQNGGEYFINGYYQKINIDNGFSKLLNYFINEYKPLGISSSVRNHDNELNFTSNGFKILGHSEPKFKYLIGGIRADVIYDCPLHPRVYDSGELDYKLML